MGRNLVIVESPAKAKTIEKFLGSDFTVTSSYGHVRDLLSDEISVDIENNFNPRYEVSPDKKKLIKELQKLAAESETVWLATDEDREGEAISWHLAESLGLDINETKRIVFHEITKPAILKAIQNPRKIDINLVNAQQARRVLDRLVGYELSPVLWKKVRPSLSAGRVQSVAVKLIVEREREIMAFEAESSFKPRGHFKVSGGKVIAELNTKLGDKNETRDFLNSCINAGFKISDIQVKPAKKSPAPPFTTSTLQQEASRKLGYSVSKTMMLAQKLYEAGHITYMRTDSVNLSQLAIDAAQNEITSQFGANYSNPRQYTTKAQGAQEAHEAIRPTYFQNHSIGEGRDESRLYELIWKRTVASQMADAKLENTNIKIDISTSKHQFVATGQQIKFDGFLKLYIESNDDDEENAESGEMLLPNLTLGQELQLDFVESRERFTRPAPRYTEASLVRKLEELGIGRPSTYAPTISTIQKRSYVTKETRPGTDRKYVLLVLKGGNITEKESTEVFGAEKNKLFPSDVGMLVNDFLDENFSGVMDYHFTAKVEEEFDHIAEGKLDWQNMLSGFYKPFHENVEQTTKEAKRVNQNRDLGIDPKTQLPVSARFGKYGPYVQLGESDTEEKPKYAKLRPGQLIESITLDEALELFKLPRTIGEFEGKPVLADVGRFGPYVKHNNKFVSIPKDEDPYEIELSKAIELIEAKRVAEANKFIKEFEHEGKKIEILNGRWGPYIKRGKENFKIPKGTKAEELDLEQTLELINNAPAKAKKGRARK
ncbi:type I DNA topoisomerase [bacterium]|nr:type I DNA topoisomerase [bacterium]